MIDPVSDLLLDSVLKTEEEQGEEYPMAVVASKRLNALDESLRQVFTYQRKEYLAALLEGRHPKIRVATCQVNDWALAGEMLGVQRECEGVCPQLRPLRLQSARREVPDRAVRPEIRAAPEDGADHGGRSRQRSRHARH